MNNVPDYQECLQYTDEVIASVRYGYMYRKESEERLSLHACITIYPDVLFWLASAIAGGYVYDKVKLAAKQLYQRIKKEGNIIDEWTSFVLSDENELKLFYDRVQEFNKHCMSVTEKQFQYIKEEIIADVYGEEAQKIYDREQRQPNHQEYLEIHRKAIRKADDLLGKYNAPDTVLQTGPGA